MSRRSLVFPQADTPPLVSSDPDQEKRNAIWNSLIRMDFDDRVQLYNEMNFYNPNRTNGPPMDAEQAHELAIFNEVMHQNFPEEAIRTYSISDDDSEFMPKSRSRSSRSSRSSSAASASSGAAAEAKAAAGVFGVIPPVQMVNPPPVPIPPDFLTSLQTLASNNEKNTKQYKEEMDKKSAEAVKNNKSGNFPRCPPWWIETWTRFTPEQKALYENLPAAFKDYGSRSWNNWSELPPPPHPHPPSSPFGVRPSGRARRAAALPEGALPEGGKAKSRSRTVMKPRKYLKPRKHLKSKKHLKSRK